MVLDKRRQRVDPLLTVLARPFNAIPPDVLSIVALLFAVGAGAFFYLSTPATELSTYFLFAATVCIACNGLFDAIDGKVAAMTRRASARGDFLDHALDRYADVFIIGGLALSAWCRPTIGLLAIVAVLLTSYMGTQAQAVGCSRNCGGLLGRADRLALLLVFPVLQHIALRLSLALPFDLTVLEIAMIIFAVVGHITALQRFYCTLRWFSKP
jgi:archaetidylinositol phosphate synthase